MLKIKKTTIVEKHRGIGDLLTNADNKALPYFQVALLIYVIILTFPFLIIDTRSDIDYSAYIGWHKAAQQGLIYGKDIVFTYGPLGFLTAPIFIDKNLWVCSAIYTLAVYALVAFGCSLYIRKMKASLIKTVIFAAIFIAVFKGMLNWRPGRDFELLISLLIFSYLYIRGKGNLIVLPGLAFLCSVLPFIKFSSVFAGGFIGAVFTYILIRDKRRKEAVIFLTATLVSFCILGLLLIGPPKAIFVYLYGSLQIASGYNDALGISGTKSTKNTAVFSAIFVWVSYISLFCYCTLRKRRDDLIYLVFSFGMLFLSFKLGFVRRDYEHAIYFYSIWLAVFGLYFLRSFADAKIVRYFVLLFICVMLYQSCANVSSFLNIYMPNETADKLKNIKLSFNLARGIGAEEQTAAIKTQISEYLFLMPETVQNLSGHTIDVFPYDVAITEAYGFKWNPRPVFQSYLAYTGYLDSLNAKHFSSESAPEYVLYALDSPDFRYAIFDEPATFRTLLREYKPCAVDGDFIVLRKNPSADTGKEEYISTETGNLGKIITLPQAEGKLLFAKVHIERNLLGLVWKLLYKPPNVYLGFFNNRDVINKRPHRFVFANAMNGLLVWRYIANQNDLLELWKGNAQQNITGILLWTDYPVFFKDKITVQFFTIPAKK